MTDDHNLSDLFRRARKEKDSVILTPHRSDPDRLAGPHPRPDVRVSSVDHFRDAVEDGGSGDVILFDDRESADDAPIRYGPDGTELVNQRHTGEYDVDIGRANYGKSDLSNTDPGDTGWLGNPFPLSGGMDREEAVQQYRYYFRAKIEDDEAFREAVQDLRGKRLACWCVPKRCHGDVILNWLEENG